MIAILIATYNRRERLEACLDSVARYTTVPHEVIVVDAGSDDGTREAVAGRGLRLVEQDGLLGLPNAFNPVWAELDCAATCWLSDDTELAGPALDSAVAVLEAQPPVGMVGLKMLDLVPNAEDYAGGVSRYGILNCNHGVVRMELLRRVGFFHEGYRAYGVDPDLTAAVLSAGAEVVMTREIAVLHHREEPVQKADQASVKENAADDPARKLYAERFRYLAGAKAQPGGRLYRYLLAGLKPGATRFGLNRRDGEVLGLAKFISPLDPWREHGPVHLRQRIPAELRASPANPYRDAA